MKKSNALVKGTIILTAAGILGKFLGLFYKIYLSNTIKTEGIGIFQLVFPIYGMFHMLCCHSIETAISKFVSINHNDKNSYKRRQILLCGFIISFSLSLFFSSILYIYSDFIAVNLIFEARCSPLLKYVAATILLSSIHSCLCGYYFGKMNAFPPAVSNLLEQLSKVLITMLIASIYIKRGYVMSPALAGMGLCGGEFASSLFCVTYFVLKKESKINFKKILPDKNVFSDMLTMIIPLSANRLVLSLLQSAEAALIPANLRLYGMSKSGALSIYGILTGMTMSLIMFPATLTNSMSVMLLPKVSMSKSESSGSEGKTINMSVFFCLVIGILCMGIFTTYGKDMGIIVFNNETAGDFLQILGFICPFIYLNSACISILNGLSRTVNVFINNLFGIIIRLSFVIILIPEIGIKAYLYGILVSQLSICVLNLHSIKKYSVLNFNAVNTILLPFIFILIARYVSLLFYNAVISDGLFVKTALSAFIMCIAYFLLILASYVLRTKKS